MTYLLYLFGFLPSAIWLLFYLRKDVHPESNRMVLKIFFLGMLSAFLAIFLEKGFQITMSFLKKGEVVNSFLTIFIGGALIEEYLKYLVVRIWVFKNSELDEPFDVILYMIISALGFAALENILILTNYHPILKICNKIFYIIGWRLMSATSFQTFCSTLIDMALRFISATFLHTLCSALLGYFIVLGFYKIRKKNLFIAIGLIIATTLHGFYNYSIMKIEGLEKFILPIVIILGGFLFLIFFGFKKVKKLKGLCQVPGLMVSKKQQKIKKVAN